MSGVQKTESANATGMPQPWLDLGLKTVKGRIGDQSDAYLASDVFSPVAPADDEHENKSETEHEEECKPESHGTGVSDVFSEDAPNED